MPGAKGDQGNSGRDGSPAMAGMKGDRGIFLQQLCLLKMRQKVGLGRVTHISLITFVKL